MWVNITIIGEKFFYFEESIYGKYIHVGSIKLFQTQKQTKKKEKIKLLPIICAQRLEKTPVSDDNGVWHTQTFLRRILSMHFIKIHI